MVLIVDSGISSKSGSNKYYSEANQKNVLMLSTINKNEEEEGKLTQHVFNNKSVFLDFFADGAKDVWAEGLNDLYA